MIERAGVWSVAVGCAALLLAGCVATEYAPPTLAHLPTATITPTRIHSELPILMPTPPGVPAIPSSAVVTGDEAAATGLSVGLPGASLPTARPLRALAALPTLAPTGYVNPFLPTATFPPTIESPSLPTEVAAAPTLAPVESAMTSVSAMTDFLYSVPLFYNFDTPQGRDIAARGRAVGSAPRVFTVVGDSNSLSEDFLRALVLPDYCRWGAYAALRDAVSYFASASLSGDDVEGDTPFTHASIAVQMGFNSAAARDPFWATDPVCHGGESPYTCELRTTRPSVVVIMLGGKDVSGMTASAYRDNMLALADEAAQRGVIPVLTTFVVLPGRDVYVNSLAFNLVLVDIAETRGIPLINLWAAASSLPDFGIAPDGTHLRTHPGHYCDFTGDEKLYGGTLRNLLTLQALDLLRLGALSVSGS